MPRDLNDPEGWRFSSFRKMRLERDQFGEDGDVVGTATDQPAALERAEDSIKGVSIQGLGDRVREPMPVGAWMV